MLDRNSLREGLHSLDHHSSLLNVILKLFASRGGRGNSIESESGLLNRLDLVADCNWGFCCTFRWLKFNMIGIVTCVALQLPPIGSQLMATFPRALTPKVCFPTVSEKMVEYVQRVEKYIDRREGSVKFYSGCSSSDIAFK